MNLKKLSLTILILTTAILFAGEHPWYPFNEGIQKAWQEKKHIVIDFYTDWCGWCKVMDKKTFSMPVVEKYLFENFVPIRIDAENRTEKLNFRGKTYTPRELTSAFQVSGFPSVAFLTPSLEIITVVPGYIEKDTFLKILEYVNKECYKSKISFEEYLKSNCDNRAAPAKNESK